MLTRHQVVLEVKKLLCAEEGDDLVEKVKSFIADTAHSEQEADQILHVIRKAWRSETFLPLEVALLVELLRRKFLDSTDNAGIEEWLSQVEHCRIVG